MLLRSLRLSARRGAAPLVAFLFSLCGGVCLALSSCGSSPSSSPGTPSASECLTGWPMPNPPATGLPNPQSYDVLPDGARVRDDVTGLLWQRALAPGGGLSWSDAVAYCGQLTLGGVGGWRLPKLIELESLVDFTRTTPAIDTAAFPDTPSLPFWTSQVDATNSGLAWYVFFSNGGAYGGNDVVDTQQVRCVR